MEKQITIQISVYDWSFMEEIIYETNISSIEDMLVLIWRFGKKVKFKKPTDKNWYYGKTMIKRLFKKGLNESEPLLKIVATNDLEKMLEEKRKAEEEARVRKEKEDQEREQRRRANPKYTIEQINSMSESELEDQLSDLYAEEWSGSKSGYFLYEGPFESIYDELTYIEGLVSSEVAERARKKSFQASRSNDISIFDLVF